ncbi:MAG: hypothetical protein IT431_05945 [Phycisphaerales bacterium]|nr:hypothetical protein [Phycisphaerales bacterium]
MPRAVVLRHDLPDGSHHFDWLLEPTPGDAGDERVLIAWRLPVAPPAPSGRFEAVRLEPHRRLYLTYEGPIAGGRGTVARVASGTGEILADTPGRFEAVVRLGDLRLVLVGTPVEPPSWILEIHRRD